MIHVDFPAISASKNRRAAPGKTWTDNAAKVQYGPGSFDIACHDQIVIADPAGNGDRIDKHGRLPLRSAA
jgi:hypothetical protein